MPGAPHGGSSDQGLKPLVDDLGEIDAREINSVPLGEGIVLRVGRYGPYLEEQGADGEPRRASVPDDVAPDELTLEKARELLETQPEGDLVLGDDPATGRQVVARNGRFGPYVTEVLPDDAPKNAKPRTASLFKSMQLDTVTLDDALRLLSLPRLVGVDPDNGEEITAQNGRYGPYLKRGTDSRSLETEDQLFDVTMEQALALYAQPKARGRQAAAPLRELGPDPVSAAPMVIKDGRFGPYVTDGTRTPPCAAGDEPETITPERAAELLADKRAAGPAKGRGRKTAAKKTTAKKTAAKKTTARTSTSKTAATTATKTAAKKSTAKKSTAKKTAAKKTAAKKAPATKVVAETSG